MSAARREAIAKAKANLERSIEEVNSASKQQAGAHSRYNELCNQANRGRFSGAEMEQARLIAVALYEGVLDALMRHSMNLTHLASLRGQP